jgi:hypothetical protein
MMESLGNGFSRVSRNLVRTTRHCSMYLLCRMFDYCFLDQTDRVPFQNAFGQLIDMRRQA